MKKIIIFGTTEIGALVFNYFMRAGKYEMLGFCVDAKYKKEDIFCGQPVYDYNTVKSIYPPDLCSIFVAMAYNNFMLNRDVVYKKVKADGYLCPTFICPEAAVYAEHVGENTIIFEHVTVQPSCSIGNNVLISPGAFVAHDTKIDDNVYIGPNVSICGHNSLGSSLFIGANSVIAPNISLAGNSFIGSGSRIFKNTKQNSAYIEAETKLVPAKLEGLKHILFSSE
jgi:sugar O-acyltransferase (sialic acid O-acetyltransferase NeuD family)